MKLPPKSRGQKIFEVCWCLFFISLSTALLLESESTTVTVAAVLSITCMAIVLGHILLGAAAKRAAAALEAKRQ